jgi:voltage-gated potassium channel
MDKTIVRRAFLLGGLLLLTLAIGVAGFTAIDGYPVFDAFYMTVITITTVGYMEVHPLSQAGRVFNSFLLMFGVTVMFFAVGTMTQTLLELGLQDRFGARRRKRVIDQLREHYIVCGFGRVGRHAALELQRAGAPFVVIDRAEARVDQARQAGMNAVLADSTRDDALRLAGVGRARGLVAALATDADNLFVILSARAMNPELAVVTRASEEEAEEKLRRAGANTVFAPFSIAGHRLANALLRPHVTTFLESTTMAGLEVSIEQVQVGAGSPVSAKSLRDLHLSRDYGVIVLAIRRAAGQMIFNPPAESSVTEGDCLIAMGSSANLRRLESLVTAKD